MGKARRFVSVLLSILLVLSFCFISQPIAVVRAEENPLPFVVNNVDKIKAIKYNYLIATDSGYSRVVSDGKSIYVEDYNNSFELKNTRSIAVELKGFVGFYNGRDNYYFVFYDYNEEENNSKEVVRVVKYSKSWSRISAAKLTGAGDFGEQIRYPFDLGECSMGEINGKLYLATGHEGYVDPQYNQGHQGFLMFEIDEASMTGKVVDADLWHSFSQHISIKDSNNIFILEESEGDEGTLVSKATQANPYRTNTIKVLKYGGQRTSAWAVATRATADGITFSDNNVLAVGTSIDQSKYSDSSSNNLYYVYLSVTPINNFTESATSLKWLSSSIKSGMKAVKIVKINSNRFVVMWEATYDEAKSSNEDPLSNHVLHYVFIDGNGNKIGQEMKCAVPLSDCEPVLKDGYISWVASSTNALEFVSLNASTGAVSTKKYLIAGEHATWEIKDGVLAITGTGKIRDGFSAGLPDMYKIKAVSIPEGITEIGDSAFERLQAETVVIPEGVKKIGKNAFAYTTSIKHIYIPDSVTEIGEDALYTGYTWVGSGGKVYYVTIHCNAGSYASQYAANNSIKCDTSGGGYNSIPGSNMGNGEWKNGKWYDSDGNQTYNGIMKWYSDGTHWTIKDSNGFIPKSRWQKIDGIWYYFDENGYMAANEWRDGYWLSSNGAQDYQYKGSWKGNSTGWWFEDESGWYPYSQWLKINGKWYYFDENGYMASSEWRDGCWLDSDGAWTYKETGSWKGNSSGWWFEDTSGWYPTNQWQKINGVWYWFDGSGYWTE